MKRRPLLSYKVSILLWILLLSFWFIPKDRISGTSYYILCSVALLISLILFLDAYNPKTENRNSFIWKLRVSLWGDPNIKN